MIHLTNISKQFGSQILLKNADLQILAGTRSGLVGANGTGKTTIFHLITGADDADDGDITFSKK
ncbi:MAG: ATP-binding cassette domain-containing protein, partial [Desulfobacterales bacterium]|nr:ATP-binding cassette domain-containing protein [Desulfobacterales bacterium]